MRKLRRLDGALGQMYIKQPRPKVFAFSANTSPFFVLARLAP